MSFFLLENGKIAFSTLNRSKVAVFFMLHTACTAFPRKLQPQTLIASLQSLKGTNQRPERAQNMHLHPVWSAFESTHWHRRRHRHNLFRFLSFIARLLSDVIWPEGSKPKIDLKHIQISSDSIIQHNCITLMEACMTTLRMDLRLVTKLTNATAVGDDDIEHQPLCTCYFFYSESTWPTYNNKSAY